MLLLFYAKYTATFGVENPGVEVYLTLAETQSENNFAQM